MRLFKRLSILSVLAVFLLPAAYAAEKEHDHAHHEQAMESLGAHVHGEVEVNIVLDGDELAVEMISPAMNIVGFEHAPSTRQQKQAVADAQALLEEPGSLFALPDAADCKAVSFDLESALIDEDRTATGQHEEHAEHHAEFHLSHALHCRNGDAVDSMTLSLFESFPGVEKIHVQWIVDGRQGAVTLDASNPTVVLK